MKHFFAHTFSILSILLGLLFEWNFCSAQTSIIDPDNDGGFESGPTFSDNGWTVVNHASANHSNWYLGTGLANGSWTFPSISQSAFISNTGGSDWTYYQGTTVNTTRSSTVQFYRDIVFPAGETDFVLSFDLIANGEAFNYDVFYIWLCPTTLTPVAGSPVAMSDITVWTGTGTPTILYKHGGTSSDAQRVAENINISIPASMINNCFEPVNKRLVFGWKNDETVNFNPPVAIDNISLGSSNMVITPGLINYTIDNTIPSTGSNFNNFSDAISWINSISACGNIIDSLVFEVQSGQVFMENTPVITATGTASAPIIFRKSGVGINPAIQTTGTGSNMDGGIVISGGDFITFDGIDISLSSGLSLEYGYLIRNASATDGALNNSIKNCSITLNKSIKSCVGILQSSSYIGGGYKPLATSGNNNNNIYQNIIIQNTYNGIILQNESAILPDVNNQVLSCSIGTEYTGIPIGNIGGSSIAVYGIQAVNQQGCVINFNTIKNLTANGTSCRGICLLNASGSNTIAGNLVRGIRNIDDANTSSATGIYAELTTTIGAHSFKIYNNMVSDITSAHAGGNTSTRVLKGIAIAGGNSTSTFNIDFNTISINGSGSLRIASVGLELGTVITQNNIRNNIIANFTAAQTGSPSHYLVFSPISNKMGATGSVCNYNDFFVANNSNGYFALTANTKRSTISQWKSAMGGLHPGIDANSKTGDPLFLNTSTDIHSVAAVTNGAGNSTGIPWVTVDIDGQNRDPVPDIGADEFSFAFTDIGFNNFNTPVESGCYNETDSIRVNLKNFSIYPINFSLNPSSVTVTATGPVTGYSSNKVVNSGLLAAGGERIVTLPSVYNMTSIGTYNFTATTSTTGDVDLSNNNGNTTKVVTGSNLIPYMEDFNAAAILPFEWINTGFSFGTHIGATESNQAYINISSVNTTGNFITRKTGIVNAATVLTFDYRVTNKADGTTVEEDSLWGNIIIYASGDCGTTYSVVDTITTAMAEYTNMTYLLHPFKDHDVMLKFETNWGGGLEADCWVDIDNINLTNSACSSMPTAGVLSSTDSVLCQNDTATLTMTGASSGLGQVYNWYISRNDINYIPVLGSDSIIQVTIDQNSYFICAVTCLGTGEKDSSDAVYIGYLPKPEGDTITDAIDIGALELPYELSGDNHSSNCWSNDYGNESPDIFYRFTTDCPGLLTVSTCGSDLNTFIYLIDSEGFLLNSNNDFCGTGSELTFEIVATDLIYYVIVEGDGTSEGNYNLNINFTSNLTNWYIDADNDGYGDVSSMIVSCELSETGYVNNSQDCDDNNNEIHPGINELCDGIDNNCDGNYDENLNTASISPVGSITTCKGIPVMFSANTGEGLTYQWFKNDHLIPGANGSTFSVNKSGSYTVQVDYPGGCFGISDPSVLTVNPNPIANIIAPNGTSLCTSVTLEASNEPGYTFQWYRNGNLKSGAVNYQLFADAPGSYYCIITNSFGCSKSSPVIVVTSCKNDTDNYNSEELIVYPIPASQFVNINLQLNNVAFSLADIMITNVLGDVVYQSTVSMLDGSLSININLRGFSKGIYLITVVVDETIFNKEIIIVN